MSGTYRGRRLYIRILPQRDPGKLPWPMTTASLRAFYDVEPSQPGSYERNTSHA